MRTLARLVFKIHKFIYGYPTKAEIKLALVNYIYSYSNLRDTIGMLYLCGENIEEISEWVGATKENVKYELNMLAKGVEL
jgi:hypothetical protein